ncbi:HAMP domain-containing histidine kinase, partial [bacterium]|nr:HAMP domain-containing histidine kinase [bacterium]
SELLQMMPENLSERQLSIIKKMDESSSVIQNMITDILDISRMEENKVKLRKEPFHILEILDANLNEMAYTMQKNGISGQLNVDNDVPMISADKDMIHRVVANLLHNAVKHSVKGGKINLIAKYEPEGTRLHVTVKDNGEGIAPQYTEKIFEKFAQADLKKLGLKTDRGLGLTFCKLAVEAHGGKIWVESKVGEGSEFKFYLPGASGV